MVNWVKTSAVTKFHSVTLMLKLRLGLAIVGCPEVSHHIKFSSSRGHRTLSRWGYPGNVDLKLLYAIFCILKLFYAMQFFAYLSYSML